MNQPAEGVGEEVRNRLPQRTKLDRVGLQPLPPGKGEQLTNELAPLFGRALGHAQDALLFLGELGPPFEQAQAADHRREQVIEVVRDPAGQFADRVHLLRLDELPFERSLLADVGQRASELDRLALRIPE